jgi:hypothetical protein
MTTTLAKLAAGAAVVVAGLTWGGAPADLAAGGWSAPAQAVIGRPLTPVSYAGVARRTTRRAVVATAAVTAPTTTVVVAPTNGCTTVVDSNGNAVQRCP